MIRRCIHVAGAGAAFLLLTPGCSTFLAASAGTATAFADEVRPAAWLETQAAVGVAPEADVDVAVGISGVGSLGRIFAGGASEDLYAVVRKEEEPVFVGSIGALQMAGRDVGSDELVADFGAIVRAGPPLFTRLGDHGERTSLMPRVTVQGGYRQRATPAEADRDAWRGGGFFSVGLVIGVFSANDFDCPHC